MGRVENIWQKLSNYEMIGLEVVMSVVRRRRKNFCWVLRVLMLVWDKKVAVVVEIFGLRKRCLGREIGVGTCILQS